MELRPLDSSHDALLRTLEEQEDVWEYVGSMLLPQEGNYLFAIVEGQVPLGIGGLVKSPTLGSNEYELVCALREDAQLRGLAHQACQLLLNWAFDTGKLEHVATCIASENQAARTVAAKLGMREWRTLPAGRTAFVKYRDDRASAGP